MSKLTTFIFLIFFTCSASFGFSTAIKTKDSISKHLQHQFKKHEKTNIDSSIFFGHRLIKHSQEISNDSILIRTYQNLGDLFRSNKQLDSALYHYNTSLEIAKETDQPYFISRAHILIGIYYSRQSELEKAKRHYQIATDINQHPNSHSYEAFVYNKTFAFNELGNIYREQGHLKKALQAFLNANTIVEENDINDEKINSLINIANIYSDDKQWTIALDKLEALLDIAKKDKDIHLEALVNNNIGTIYEDLKEFKKALPYYIEALKIRDSLNITTGVTLANHNLGSINFQLGNYSQAIKFLNKSMASNLKINSKLNLVYDYEYLARIYIKLEDFDKANIYLTRSINFAEELHLTQKELDLAKLETEYYFGIGKLDLAQKAFLEYDSLRNDFIETEKSDKIIQMQTLYETEKKEKENDLLKAQNQLTQLNLDKEIQRKNQYFIGFGISIVILIIIIFLLRRMSIAHKTIEDFNIKLEDSNKKLQLINSTQDKFFSIIAHDLRSPLGAILSFSNLIDDECSSSKEIETVTEYNTYLNQSATNLNSLLENLLQWSKSQLGSIKHHASILNLASVIENNIEIQRLKAKEKSIDIKSEIDENISVYADVNMLSTIIRNLISNAIKFSYPKSEIILFAESKGDRLHLSVQDQGIGINKNKQERLFKIDSNLSTPGTNNETGTGLGLILCKEFAETNGGTIWITSEESKGATFTFTIPIKEV